MATSKTRICVKNLPPSTTEYDLKEFFRQASATSTSSSSLKKGKDDDDASPPFPARLEITDCKVLKNAKGKSRKVAFLGFRKEEHAAYVVNHFHRTYMGMTRISVEWALAKKTKDDQEEGKKDKSKIVVVEEEEDDTTDPTNKTKKTKKDSSLTTTAAKESRHKKELKELLASSGGPKSKFWSNDEGLTPLPLEGETNDDHDHDDRDAHQSSDDEQHHKKNQKIGREISSDDSTASNSNGKNDDDEDDDSDSDEDDTIPGKQSQKQQRQQQPSTKKKNGTGLSDLDFLRSKQTTTDDLEMEGGENSNQGMMQIESTIDARREEDINTDSEADDNDDDDSSSSSSSSSSNASDDENDEGHTKTQVNPPLQKSQEDNDDDNDETGEGSNVRKDADDHDDDDNESSNEQDDARKEQTSKSRLFVRNLPFGTTEEELSDYFSTYGALVECHIPVDDQKRNKGFAFVQYASAVDALEAKNQLDKIDFQGRLLHILPAKPAPKQSSSMGNEHLSWKEKQEFARKEQDTKNGTTSNTGWSASFVRGDAVVDNLAERLGLRKADFLAVKDKLSSGDAAVRLALGETQIIEENRTYFRQNGIDMDALVSANGTESQRSTTSMLVKNLPFDTHVDELAKLFQVGNVSVKIFLPPSRTIALVEYSHHSDAKKAFKRLAYRRFKHVPIYLEWAPLAAKTKEGEKATENNNTTLGQNTPLSESLDDIDADIVDGTTSTIYVKNLNFTTSEETLRQVFEKNLGPVVRSVRIPQKVAPTKIGVGGGEEEEQQSPPQLMSMGYGFVELQSEAAVKRALEVLQGKLVDGHAWGLTVSSNNNNNNRGGKSKLTTQGSNKNPTKLIVRNVPFQANRTEILKLFGSFGQLRKVRLPKKFDGTHRGFAFVEYVTSKEAIAAMSALSRTHLYGRHLVLEWATDEDDDNPIDGNGLDRLRNKARRDIETPLPKNKRIKFT